MNPHYAAVAARAKHRCEYCGALEAVFNLPFEVEHIVPPGRGGLTILANLALACRSCNLFKSDKTKAIDPATGSTVQLFHPRFDVWAIHFRLEEDGTILGLTDVGRATALQLKLNAQTQVDARVLWRRLEMPPGSP